MEFEYEIQLKEVFRVLKIVKAGEDAATGKVTLWDPVSADSG